MIYKIKLQFKGYLNLLWQVRCFVTCLVGSSIISSDSNLTQNTIRENIPPVKLWKCKLLKFFTCWTFKLHVIKKLWELLKTKLQHSSTTSSNEFLTNYMKYKVLDKVLIIFSPRKIFENKVVNSIWENWNPYSSLWSIYIIDYYWYTSISQRRSFNSFSLFYIFFFFLRFLYYYLFANYHAQRSITSETYIVHRIFWVFAM